LHEIQNLNVWSKVVSYFCPNVLSAKLVKEFRLHILFVCSRLFRWISFWFVDYATGQSKSYQIVLTSRTSNFAEQSTFLGSQWFFNSKEIMCFLLKPKTNYSVHNSIVWSTLIRPLSSKICVKFISILTYYISPGLPIISSSGFADQNFVCILSISSVDFPKK